MHVSQAGLDFIKQWESCRLTAYRDSAGVETIGFGHVGDVHEGQTITQHQADELLRHDLKTAEECVDSTCPGLDQHRFDACVSLTYNIGCSAFENSTLAKLIWAGAWPGAAKQFERWSHAGGEFVQGLANRRHAESLMFLGSVP